MMIAVFLVCLSLALARGFPPPQRIVGGSDAPAGSRPYQVTVLFSDSATDLYCSGSLVHPKWVVTAGNCVGPLDEDVYVGLGFTNLLDSSGTHIIKGTYHLSPQFDYDTLDGDLALIELDKEVPLSNTIKTIKIAAAGSDVAGGTKVLTSGWGSTESDDSDPDKLQQVVLEILDRNTCDARYVHEKITSNMICTESKDGKDTCWSDEGGPLVTNFSENSHSPSTTLVGVISWGWECADKNFPAMYNRLTNYCSWIETATGSDVKCGS